MRIVSLVPSITELLVDLGLDDELIGITKFCIHPAHLKQTKTIVGGTKNVHVDRERSNRPDLIIANREENTKEQVELLQTEFAVYLTDINTLDDALNMIRETGRITNRESTAHLMASSIEIEFNKLAKSIASQPRRKVAYLIWKDPKMAAGGNTYINDMLERCGFENVLKNIDRYPTITIDYLKNSALDIILLSSEPYPFKQRHVDELAADLPGITIRLVDGEMFSWYGSRMLKAAPYLQRLVASV